MMGVDDLEDVFASALLWGVAVRGRIPWYEFPQHPAFAHVRFACEPLPVHWDGLTTAAIAVRVDLEDQSVSPEARQRLLEAGHPTVVAEPGQPVRHVFLCEDTFQSQHQNRKRLLARLREVLSCKEA